MSRTERTVRVFTVVAQTGAVGGGPAGDGSRVFRFRSERQARTFAVGKALYGQPATVDQDDVPVSLARRWGVA
jgi:hypothetical protein